MIALEDAKSRLLALAPDLEGRTEATPLGEVSGRYLRADIAALRSQPVRDLSAMDGYAVAGPGPWHVRGESAAGNGWRGTLTAGEAVRIFTGAIVPDGADAVVMQEDMEADGDKVSLSASFAIRNGQHIRRKASDFSEGGVLLHAGECLTPARIALAASCGHGTLPVARPVTIALISTGNELQPAGTPCSDEQIPSSNGLMLRALLERPGVIVRDAGIIPDEKPALAAALAAAQSADIIITIGGASVGDHDLVRPVLLELGAEMDFWKVAIKPGKPLMCGRLGGSIIIGLPGNPVSAYVTAMLFAVPLIEAMRGNPKPEGQRANVLAATDLPANGNRTDHVRARLVEGMAWPVGVNDSAALVALSQADALIVRAPGTEAVQAGEIVEVILLA